MPPKGKGGVLLAKKCQAPLKNKPPQTFQPAGDFFRFKLAETHRSRTYHRPLSLPLVLKTRRNTGYEALPWMNLRERQRRVKGSPRASITEPCAFA